MSRYEEDRSKKIYEIITVVKVLSIFFGAIAIFSEINAFENWLDLRTTIAFCLMLIFSCYQLLLYPSKKTQLQNDNISMTSMIEILVLVAIFTFIIIFTGGHESSYKALFLFIIITSTIQFGTKWGIITATLCSLSIAAIDLFSLPLDMPNPFFQSDLVYIGIFFLSAWLLGHYIKTEEFFRILLNNMANMDELTGLYNHRHFQECLKRELGKAKALKTPLSLLFGDLDYFKYYNDVYGHQAGDAILIQVARIVENKVSTSGSVFRYGGEEFAVLLPGIDENDAITIAEKARKGIENHIFVGEETQPNERLTISIGVSTFPTNAKNKSDLIKNADEALYKAKFISKNKVETYFCVLDQLKEQLSGAQLDLISSIRTLLGIINVKDRYTYGHTERVVQYCCLIGDLYNLPDDKMKILQYGAYLHDIGKIELSKDVLNKPEKLTSQEWNELKQHPLIGSNIVKPVETLRDSIPLILYHHERLDGKGYPHGLKGDKIPMLVRILSIADSFDAMTTERPYKKHKTLPEAIQELRKNKGTQFDPDIVEKFVEVISDKDEFFFYTHKNVYIS